MSNSFSALNEEEEDDDEEEVENVYDESANLIQNTKPGGSSSFTATAEFRTYKKKIDEDGETKDKKCLMAKDSKCGDFPKPNTSDDQIINEAKNDL
ncbi:hypothetical protein Tco_0843705 [Tanacetum coccineum]